MLIAHDFGTSGDKAVLVDRTGAVVATATAPYETSYGHLTSEQNPEDWWKAAVATTRELLARTGTDPADVAGICSAGTMMALVCVDDALRPLRPALIWSDQRSAPQAERIEEAVGADSAYRITGSRMAATYTLPKLAWLREQEPEVLARTRWVLGHKDYVNARLTGRAVTDASDASSTAMYDLAGGAWSAPLLAAAGVDAAILPPIVTGTEVIGTLAEAPATELGLTTRTKVVAGGGDGPMAAVGAGCVRAGGTGYVCLGTSAWYSRATAEPVWDPGRRSMTFHHLVPGLFTPTATTQAGAGTLTWLRDSLHPTAGIADVVAEGLSARAADEGLFFLPYLTGERSPWWNPDASGVFAGLRRHHGRAQMIRAGLEGVAFGIALCMEPLVSPSEPVDVIGGGAASGEWLRLMADVWGRPVRRRTITSEATSLGAAVTGLVGVGMAGFDLAEGLSTIDLVAEPGPGADRYRAHLARFCDAYRAVEPWFTRGRARDDDL